MFIVKNKCKYEGKKARKIYSSTLLCHSYREDGKVKKKVIANLSSCTTQEIEAIEFALKYKDDLESLGSLKDSVDLEQGLSVGAVWTIYEVSRQLGIEKALGKDFSGKLALWQICARVIDQGSRLSAVRLAQNHAACSCLDINRGFDENDLYENLTWIAENQGEIEKRLFSARRGDKKPEIFLYDVTSSYLEWNCNYFGEYGYNRDGKKGKKQIVIGLLCDEFGEPVSTEVFRGNTQDPKTFSSQVKKAAERFGCERVTYVGDRGMIKRAEIESLPESCHYITAITKPQIESLMKKKVIQVGLFDSNICEVQENEVRYILRKNPIRADELTANRLSKRSHMENLLMNKNAYLKEHPRASVEKGLKDLNARIDKLKIDRWVSIESEERLLKLMINEDALKEEALLDGCYVIKTDLPKNIVDMQIIHDRYKDLTLVEIAFRDCKTISLEARPIFFQTEKNTVGHVEVVMLSYLVIRRLREAWIKFDLTVKEGIDQLSSLCAIDVKIKDGASCIKIPRPRKEIRELLNALKITLPIALPYRNVKVVTRKKLQTKRKLHKKQQVKR